MATLLSRPVTAAVLAAVTGVGALLGVVGLAAPAGAAACGTGTGVTVVVDFKQLGGGVHTFCAPDGAGRSAASLVGEHFPLTYVQRQPGFLCRVNGVPAEDPCVNTPPATAYWGLFHSDGSSGTWSFSSLGVGSLKVGDGGSIGLAWQQGAGRSVPGVAAPVHAAEPTPSSEPKPEPKPKPKPSKNPNPEGERSPGPSPDGSGSPSASPSAPAPADTTSTDPGPGGDGATASPDRDGKRSGDGRAGRDEEDQAGEGGDATTPPAAGSTSAPAEPAVEPTAADSDGQRVPTAVTLGLLAALLAGISLALWRRRRA